MISAFVKEQKRYNEEELKSLFNCNQEKLVKIIKKLKEYGIVKSVKKKSDQKDLSDLDLDYVEIENIEVFNGDYFYVFTFVGIVSVNGFVLKCYPKYITCSNELSKKLKQVLKVIEKYNKNEQIIKMYNDSEDSNSFNLLAVMLYMIEDYYDYGIYTNTQELIEENGNGDILWDKTINETFAILDDNRAYYTTFLTKKRVNDDSDYFKRLHECILSMFIKELENAELLEVFDIEKFELTDEELDDFGDIDYICYRINNELSRQFNTRKQLILKTIYAYIVNRSSLSSVDNFSLYGTNKFHIIWEEVCSKVMDNKLDSLKHLIEKPKWTSSDDLGDFTMEADKTLIPDIISLYDNTFVIFDAKYYFITLKRNSLKNHPGVSDVTKQYLYQLAFLPYILQNKIDKVKNCFLMPTEEDSVIVKGVAKMDMLTNLDLEPIQVRLLPVNKAYELYLNGDIFDINELVL